MAIVVRECDLLHPHTGRRIGGQEVLCEVTAGKYAGDQVWIHSSIIARDDVFLQFALDHLQFPYYVKQLRVIGYAPRRRQGARGNIRPTHKMELTIKCT